MIFWVLAGFLLLTGCLQVEEPGSVRIEATADRLARGEYLSRHVTGCTECHGLRDWSKFSGPIIPDSRGGGGQHFGRAEGLPGEFHVPNITPTKTAGWTDGELLQAFTEGYAPGTGPLFPLMPYPRFAILTREDAWSIAAYLRTLPALPGKWPPAELDFPLNLLIRTLPAKARPTPAADLQDELAYGHYLTTIATCSDCHSPVDGMGQALEGKEYGGGVPMIVPTGGMNYSANITPDVQTGIGNWTREMFIGKFRAFRDRALVNRQVAKNTFNTVMPWSVYAGMTDQDLAAIFTYLKSLPPVSNKVVTFVADTRVARGGTSGQSTR